MPVRVSRAATVSVFVGSPGETAAGRASMEGSFMKVSRIISDDEGESHFDDVVVPFAETEFIKGAQSLGVTHPWSAEAVSIAKIPSRWSDAKHPTPVRQMVVFLSGLAEMTASDGESRVFEKGDIVMLEDVGGRGHGTRFLSDEESLVMLVRLA